MLETPWAFAAGEHNLPRAAILHQLRCIIQEELHKTAYWTTLNQYWMYRPRFDRLDSPDGPLQPWMADRERGPLSDLQGRDCCNKIAPFYIVEETDSGVASHASGIACGVHNWLFQRWHRPYRSEMDYGQFIGKMIAPVGSYGHFTPAEATAAISKLNKLVCEEVEQ